MRRAARIVGMWLGIWAATMFAAYLASEFELRRSAAPPCLLMSREPRPILACDTDAPLEGTWIDDGLVEPRCAAALAKGRIEPGCGELVKVLEESEGK